MEMVSETTQAYSSGSCPVQHYPWSESPLIQQVRIKLSVNTNQSDLREDKGDREGIPHTHPFP